MKKVGLVLAGYLGAFLAAGLTFCFCQARAQDNPSLYSSGMSAGGDFILVLAVFGMASLFPTALALYFLRAHEKFWGAFGWAGLAFAATGPLAEILNTLIQHGQLYQQPLWALAGFLSMVRTGGGVNICRRFRPFRPPCPPNTAPVASLHRGRHRGGGFYLRYP